MKTLILFVVVALSFAAAEESSPSSTKQKRGILEWDHAPLLASPWIGKSTPIIHSAPVITKVFDAPPLPLVKSWEPLITGPLIAKGWGPHILPAKTILPAPIYTKQILAAPAPIISLAPKWATAPAALTLGHGW